MSDQFSNLQQIRKPSVVSKGGIVAAQSRKAAEIGVTVLAAGGDCVDAVIATGFALAFARGLGEYGSVVFVSGNMPFRTEIAPVLIVGRLEEYKYAEATAIAMVLLVGSIASLGLINWLERWSRRHDNDCDE